MAGLERLNAGFANFAASQSYTSYACQDVAEVKDDDSLPLDIEEDMRVTLFYICEKKVCYQMRNIFKPKAQVE